MNSITLEEKIKKEMTVNYDDALEKNFEMALKFIRITKKGYIDVLNKDKLSGKDSIMAYLIGKIYAQAARYSETDCVKNKELMDELGIKEGSLLPWLKSLRDKGLIKKEKIDGLVHHRIMVNQIEKTLKNLREKLNN